MCILDLEDYFMKLETLANNSIWMHKFNVIVSSFELPIFFSNHAVWYLPTSYSFCSQVVESSQTCGFTHIQQQLLFSLPRCSLSIVSSAQVTCGRSASRCFRCRINGTKSSYGRFMNYISLTHLP